MPTVLSIVLSLVGLFLIQYVIRLLLGLQRVARNVGLVWFGLQNNQLINPPVTFDCSKLSGPFFFFPPLSIPGHLLSQVAWEIPYLHSGKAWVLRKKYEGMSV